jgi:pyruvate,water dikinase
MEPVACRFADLPESLDEAAGGKAGVLARLYRAGYPVPDGFVIFPDAFQAGRLTAEARTRVLDLLAELRDERDHLQVAVRSSARGEDSRRVSFAGEFDTVLNVGSDDAVLEAVHRVQQSGRSDRAAAYASFQGLAQVQEMAVVVQRMVPARLAGVLFTADPVTGSHGGMVGNYVEGLGDALMAGEADGQGFSLARPRGRYQGPDDFRPHGRKLFKLAQRMERSFGVPLDIEWALDGKRLRILQARPITTLSAGDIGTYDINETMAEDTLWVNTNVAEAVPDVLSPLTWSVIRFLDEEFNYLPGYYLWSGNICGRVYSNIGRRISVVSAVTGWDGRRVMGLLGDMFGASPDQVEVPLHPFSRSELLRELVPRITRFALRSLAASRDLQGFLRDTAAWCDQARCDIGAARDSGTLLDYGHRELLPYLVRAWWGHTAGSSRVVRLLMLNRKLKVMVGEEEANALLSNLRGDDQLASLGLLNGISQVITGELDRDEYLRQFGHRGPHEFELSMPAPSEDPDWLEKQLHGFGEAGVTANVLLERQQRRQREARERFLARWPRKRRWLERRLAVAAAGAQAREAARSEFTRVFRVIRAFALRVGEVTGIGDDVFFLYWHEVLGLLAGDHEALLHVPARRRNHARFQSFPPFPSIIRGRFDPTTWMRDPDRRLDYYDALRTPGRVDGDTLAGFPGAPGCVEGVVRVLADPESGGQLRAGEILVTATTNVGWTPLFPKAAALITDIGAPLSHAAIVARELGIPAVVGCGNATRIFATGDRVRVDGGRGIVQRLR